MLIDSVEERLLAGVFRVQTSLQLPTWMMVEIRWRPYSPIGQKGTSVPPFYNEDEGLD
jgi:hypothetical protein